MPSTGVSSERSRRLRGRVRSHVASPWEGGVIVASALGAKGDWFLNVRTSGKARIHHGRRRYNATADVVPPHMRAAPLNAFSTAHPKADVIAERYTELYETRLEPELHYVALDK